ncbi:hypothetical protein Tco_0197829, partial [Tanacetum coccineum]
GQSQPKPMEVPEHYGLSDFDFSVLQNTEGLQQDGPKTLILTWPKGPQRIRRRLRSQFRLGILPLITLSPFTCMPTTTVATKKRANNTRNKTRSDKVSAFNIEKAGIDLNSPVEDLVYMGSHDTDVTKNRSE